MELKPGDKAPSSVLPPMAAVKYRWPRSKGQPFVLYFYPKDDTTGCTKEAIGFSEAKKKFGDVPVIGVSKDTTASHDRFKAKYKLKIALASDPETQTAQDYGVWGEKKHCTAENIWAWNGPHFWWTPRALSTAFGAK